MMHHRITPDERTTIRALARRVREIALEPVHATNIQRWKNLNALKPGRPLIRCNPPVSAWKEMLPDRLFVATDPFLRRLEMDLRMRIYQSEHLPDDLPLTACVHVPLVQTVSDWLDGTSAAQGKGCVLEPANLDQMREPVLIIDREQSRTDLEIVQELVGDILDVRQGVPFGSSKGWGESLIDELVRLRGLEQLCLDFYDDSAFVHAAMAFMRDGILRLLDQYEREQALFLNNEDNGIGSCGLGHTDELPGQPWDAAHLVTRNLWGYAMAQELTVASPAVLEEFILPYQASILERFGLTCYGCCESNDHKWGIIKKQIPRLRMVSVSPFSNHEIAAAELQDKYVYVWKPHPAAITTGFDEVAIRAELERVFTITRGCRVAVSLADTETLEGDPGRLGRWIEIARQASIRNEPIGA